MRRLRYGRPLWLDHAGAKRKYPRHRGHLETDIVIVGGGITGAICAYLFADAGVRVVLLESGTVARGSTSASTALLMQEPDRDFTDLASRFGRAAAREIWKSLGKANRGPRKNNQGPRDQRRSLRMRLGVFHARSGQSEGASKRVRCAESGRASGTLAHGRGALPHDRHESAGSYRHIGQCTGKPDSRVRRIPGGCRPPRRERFRAIARAQR